MKPLFEYNKNRTGGFQYPFYVASVATETEGYTAVAHWHYHFELLYFPYGSASVTVGSKEYKVGKGEIILINPCEVHSVTVERDVFSKHYVIGCDAGFLTGMTNMNLEITYLLIQAISISQSSRVFKIDIHDNIEAVLEELKKEYDSKEIGFEMAIASTIYRFFVRILRELQHKGLIPKVRTQLQKNNLSKIIEVLKYVETNYMEEITAAAAANMCFVSYSHFSKLFKEIMQTSFMEYLNNVRLSKAELLLLDGNKSITQIAFETGFNDTSYFIKKFKFFRGVSPKQYMITNREKK